jgi:hypothetical protein
MEIENLQLESGIILRQDVMLVTDEADTKEEYIKYIDNLQRGMFDGVIKVGNTEVKYTEYEIINIDGKFYYSVHIKQKSFEQELYDITNDDEAMKHFKATNDWRYRWEKLSYERSMENEDFESYLTNTSGYNPYEFNFFKRKSHYRKLYENDLAQYKLEKHKYDTDVNIEFTKKKNEWLSSDFKTKQRSKTMDEYNKYILSIKSEQWQLRE